MIDTILRVVGNTANVVFGRMNDLSMRQWSVVAVVLLVIGAFCMRGFGSVKKY